MKERIGAVSGRITDRPPLLLPISIPPPGNRNGKNGEGRPIIGPPLGKETPAADDGRIELSSTAAVAAPSIAAIAICNNTEMKTWIILKRYTHTHRVTNGGTV